MFLKESIDNKSDNDLSNSEAEENKPEVRSENVEKKARTRIRRVLGGVVSRLSKIDDIQ
jgi:hypothetical protein